ncbi:MAG TPA: hypothetical protein VF427_11380 [Noviherbaspirillum sp.]
MTRQILIVILTAAVFMTACSLLPAKSGKAPDMASAQGAATAKKTDSKPSDRVVVEDSQGRVEVQKVEFRSGVSSATVERLAKRYGCEGFGGAGLLTKQGPVEVYRMQCNNGSTFMAQCELRQCQPMHK